MNNGSALENDPGYFTSYFSMHLDRLQYRYNCYHFNVRSLDGESLQYVRTASSKISNVTSSDGFGGCAPSIIVQPEITNLLSADDTEPDQTMLANVIPLDWEFC